MVLTRQIMLDTGDLAEVPEDQRLEVDHGPYLPEALDEDDD